MVLPGVAAFTRVCAYDRPGTMGESTLPSTRTVRSLPSRSDPVAPAAHAQDMVDELHALLHAAEIPGPYVLAAHSAGGLVARLYASDVPRRGRRHGAAGLHPRGCLAPFPGGADPGTMGGVRSGSPSPTRTSSMPIRRRSGGTPPRSPTRPLRPGAPGAQGGPAAADAAGRVDAWHPVWRPVSGLAAAEMEAIMHDLRARLAALVPNAHFAVATESGHDIHQDQPELVIEAIREVVDAIHDPSTWTSQAEAPIATSGDFAGLVDIGGRTLYLECHGTGSPTVVLVAGYRASGRYWSDDLLQPDDPRQMVLPGVAESTRVCTYDRPGTYASIGEDDLPQPQRRHRPAPHRPGGGGRAPRAAAGGGGSRPLRPGRPLPGRLLRAALRRHLPRRGRRPRPGRRLLRAAGERDAARAVAGAGAAQPGSWARTRSSRFRATAMSRRSASARTTRSCARRWRPRRCRRCPWPSSPTASRSPCRRTTPGVQRRGVGSGSSARRTRTRPPSSRTRASPWPARAATTSTRINPSW